MKQRNLIYFVILIPLFVSTSTIQSYSTTSSDIISGESYSLEDYHLLIYFVKEGKFDMSLHIDGSGDLKDKALDVSLGSLFIMANYKLVYSDLHPLDLDIHLIGQEKYSFSTFINIESNFTAKNYLSSVIDNVSTTIQYSVSRYYSLLNINTTSHLLAAQRIYTIPISTNNQTSFNPVDLLFISLFISVGVVFVYIIVKNVHVSHTIWEKNESIDKSIVRDFQRSIRADSDQLQQITQAMNDRFEEISFSEYITYQSAIARMIEGCLAYPYESKEHKNDLISVKSQLDIDLHNINYDCISTLKNEVEGMKHEIVDKTNIIEGHTVFKTHSINFKIFREDFTAFITYCKEKSKNNVFEQMEQFSVINRYELNSFKESFMDIPGKEINLKSEFVSFYALIKDLFHEENTELLKIINQVVQLNSFHYSLNDKLAGSRDKITVLVKTANDLVIVLNSLTVYNENISNR